MSKTYACADLHGMYNLWIQIKKYLRPEDKLYMLGDAADRGINGWKIIKEVLTDPRVIYIRGNHDQMLLDCWRSDWRDNYIWFYNGGYETYDSVLCDEKSEIYLTQLAKTKLYYCYENKNGQKIHLSHAGFTLMENNEIPNKDDLLWDREHINDSCLWWPKENPNDYIVHGHSYCASKTSFDKTNVQLNETNTVGRYCHGHKICIDGRSFRNNRIALLDLDELQEIIIQ